MAIPPPPYREIISPSGANNSAIWMQWFKKIQDIANIDVTDKADKVVGATVGNFASLTVTGNLSDSGHKDTDYADASHDHGTSHTGLLDDDHTIYILVAGTRAFTGSQKTAGIQRAVSTKVALYTTLATDEVIVCNSAVAFTVTLIAASGSGRVYAIKNINTGVVTVDGDGADTIDGAASVNLIQWEAIQLVDYAANKWVII